MITKKEQCIFVKLLKIKKKKIEKDCSLLRISSSIILCIHRWM